MYKIPLLSGLIAVFLYSSSLSYAQSFYSFSKKTASYTYLSGATVLSTDLSQPNHAYSLPNGFKLFDTPMGSTIQIGSNGYIVNTGASRSFAFDPYLADLKARPSGSSISAKTEITGGDTIVKIEWRNVTVNGSPANDSLNFQVWLYKKTQAVELYYGPSNCSAGFDTAIINLSFLSTDFVTSYESHTINGTPATAADDKDPNTQIEMVGTIPAGTVYSFTRAAAGIRKTAMQKVMVYPNPAVEKLHVETGSNMPEEYKLYDMLGKLVVSDIITGKASIDVAELPKGAYTLTIAGEIIPIVHQ